MPAAAPDAFWSAPLPYVRNHASGGSFQTAVYDGSGTQIAAMTAGGIQMGLTNVTLPIVDPRGAPLLVMREAYSISFGGFGGGAGSRALRVEDGGGCGTSTSTSGAPAALRSARRGWRTTGRSCAWCMTPQAPRWRGQRGPRRRRAACSR